MGRRRLVIDANDRGSANDPDRYDWQRDQAIRRNRDRDGATGRAEARALVRVPRGGHVVVHARHRVDVRLDAVMERAEVMTERLGRREHKRETDQERAQPSPDHFILKTSTCGLRLEENAPLVVPNTIVTELAPDGVEIW